jgi:hypothetical protein
MTVIAMGYRDAGFKKNVIFVTGEALEHNYQMKNFRNEL